MRHSLPAFALKSFGAVHLAINPCENPQDILAKANKKLDLSNLRDKITQYSIEMRRYMAEEKKESMTSLKDILQGVLSGTNMRFNPSDSEIWEIWDEVVGPAIAEHASPSKITKNKLIVHVPESAWLQELEYVSETIKEKLNQRLGRKAVDKIIFRPGSI